MVTLLKLHTHNRMEDSSEIWVLNERDRPKHKTKSILTHTLPTLEYAKETLEKLNFWGR